MNKKELNKITVKESILRPHGIQYNPEHFNWVDSMMMPVDTAPFLEGIKYRCEFAATNEMVWSRNGMEYDTIEEAQAFADSLSQRWFGYWAGRIVPTTTPDRQAVDLDNHVFYQKFR